MWRSQTWSRVTFLTNRLQESVRLLYSVLHHESQFRFAKFVLSLSNSSLVFLIGWCLGTELLLQTGGTAGLRVPYMQVSTLPPSFNSDPQRDLTGFLHITSSSFVYSLISNAPLYYYAFIYFFCSPFPPGQACESAVQLYGYFNLQETPGEFNPHPLLWSFLYYLTYFYDHVSLAAWTGHTELQWRQTQSRRHFFSRFLRKQWLQFFSLKIISTPRREL